MSRGMTCPSQKEFEYMRCPSVALSSLGYMGGSMADGRSVCKNTLNEKNVFPFREMKHRRDSIQICTVQITTHSPRSLGHWRASLPPVASHNRDHQDLSHRVHRHWNISFNISGKNREMARSRQVCKQSTDSLKGRISWVHWISPKRRCRTSMMLSKNEKSVFNQVSFLIC